MKKSSFLLALAALLWAFNLSAQSTQMFERISAPVQANGVDFDYPFAGGLNAPQFSQADLDHDLLQDLVLFDRVGNVVLTFINEGTAGAPNYVFRHEYACNFPDSLTDWMLMRDFDKDGAMDIFCAAFSQASQEIQVFKGYYDGHGLKFTPQHFTYPPNCSSCNSLYIFYPDDNSAFWNNFPINRGDIPSIDDIDGDGDLDIVAFSAGTSTSLTMLINTSVEKGLPLSKPQYELYDNCWGRFFENGMERCHAELSCHPDTCYTECAGFRSQIAEERDGLHPGATPTTLDYDNDGDKDLMLGNVAFPCVDLMFNGGTSQNAWMSAQDTSFPSNNVPIDLNSFPATYYFDYDDDGKKDLVAALNNPTSGEDRKGVWYYKNASDAAGLHKFELQVKNLFQGDMIDVGTAAHPAFADVNADGLLDLVVGNYGYYTFINNQAKFTNSRLFLFLNVGTPTVPAFELADSDWAGLSLFSDTDYDFTPGFGDIDGDDDLDLLVGSNVGGIYCYRNTAGPDQPMILSYDTDPMWLSLDVGGSVSAPIVYDLDSDGLQDLVLGERAGNINFFKNNGSSTHPIYPASPTLPKIGQIDTKIPPEVVGMSTPAIIQTPDGPIIVTGAQKGHLEAYYLKGASQDTFFSISQTWGNIDEGNRSHPAFADIDNDGILDMAVGNQRGGLALYRTEMVNCTVPLHTASPNTPALRISPNPARAWAHVDWSINKTIRWQAFNALGQLTAHGESASGSFNVEVRNWETGIYILKAEAEGTSAAGRLVVVH
ncbi:MAG: T9SS type A sorting domain-containing protein [Phycisphaerae bacterium]|nr:T9SS type A sorting domain-containing protein [Saprospiraceae bacterium]